MTRLGLVMVIGLAATPAWAQTAPAEPVSEATVRVVGVPAGVTLGVVGRTPGIPVILQALSATPTSPLGTLTVENPGEVALTHLRLAVTWTPNADAPRRRTVTVPVAIPAGATAEVSLTDLEPTARGVGLTGAIEVALAGARTADGARYAGSPGPVWASGISTVACGDAQWLAYAEGALMPDGETGLVVRCQRDGRWLDAASEEAAQ